VANNVPITAGTGTDIATDDAAGVHYQRMKLSNGEVDSTVHLGIYAEDEAAADGDTGIMALAKRMDTPANTSGTDGDYEALQISGGLLWTRTTSKLVRLQTDVILPTSSVYAVNDAISDSTSAPTSGGFTFSSAARISGGGGVIRGFQACTSVDAATTLVGDVFIFNASVTNINDNAVFAVSDAEIKTCIARLSFSLEDVGNNGFYEISGLEIPYVCSGSANLRFLIRAKNAYTPATDTLTFSLVVEYYD